MSRAAHAAEKMIAAAQKRGFWVLCLKRTMPSQSPGPPPKTAMTKKHFSGIRGERLRANCLSAPHIIKLISEAIIKTADNAIRLKGISPEKQLICIKNTVRFCNRAVSDYHSTIAHGLLRFFNFFGFVLYLTCLWVFIKLVIVSSNRLMPA